MNYEIENLNFSYGKHQILNDVKVSIPEGKCYALLGANGCGKTTMISILAGTYKASSGTLTLKTGEVCHLEHSRRSSKIGYVPQENPLIPTLNGYDNLLLWFNGSKKDFNNALRSHLISMLGINDYLKKPVTQLSGGMKRRLSLAIGLINSPELLLLDEPSAALDLPCKQDMLGYLEKYLEEGGTIILTTHEEAELNLCSEYMVLKNGKLTLYPASTPTKELLDKF